MFIPQVSAFTIFDENATDNTDRIKKASNVWAPSAQDSKNAFGSLQPAGEVKRNTFGIFEDDAAAKNQRQVLAPITHNFEDSTCSFASFNTSLHQSDFLLLTKEAQSKDSVQHQVIFTSTYWCTL